MKVSKKYVNLLNGMTYTSLEKEKESIIQILSNKDTLDTDFYNLIKKLELIYQITLKKFKKSVQKKYS
ncbi:hypothetical protein [Gottfriedia luciferensis]|uniref:hypothetical protein n=1 Tax=Gottfriedia luciferensis TaxID=178774 RepID=UPI000B444F8D|nr:hypothetical protein [Gottfriedia luciferensis]